MKSSEDKNLVLVKKRSFHFHRNPNFFSITSFLQILYSMWANLTIVGIGLTYGFAAVSVPQLETSSEFSVTLDQGSWIASIPYLVSPVGCIGNGFISDRFGRKTAIILAQIPMCIGWFMTGLANSAHKIIIGRVITGLGSGMSMGSPRLYNTEISLPNMRGVIGAFPNLAMGVGIMIQAVLGSALKWRILCYVSGGYAAVIMLSDFFLPETPYYILMKHDEEKAKKYLKKFRGKDYDVMAELKDMREYKEANNIRELSLREQISAMCEPPAIKPFCIIFFYLLIGQCSGVNIIINWGIDMLQLSKSTVDAKVGNIIIATTRLISGIVTSFLLFYSPKRTLAISSSIGVGCSCVVLFIYLQNTSQPNVLPQICYVFWSTFGSIGYYTLPFLMMSELYPLQVRGCLSGITISVQNIMMFGVAKAYPVMRDNMGFSYTILFYGISSLLGCLFFVFFLPETKGLTLQEIEEFFNKRRATLTSKRMVMNEDFANELESQSPGISDSQRKILKRKPWSTTQKEEPNTSKKAKDETDVEHNNETNTSKKAKDETDVEHNNETVMKDKNNDQ